MTPQPPERPDLDAKHMGPMLHGAGLFVTNLMPHDPSCATCHPCPVRSSISEQPCLLADGHPMWDVTRFHRYAMAPR